MHSVMAKYTNSEGSTIVRSVTGLDGVKAWPRRHANYSRRTLENNIQGANSGFVGDVGSLGNMSEGREGADDDEIG